MARSTADIIRRIELLTTPGFRSSLLSRGLARGLVWRDGALPPEAPQFSADLTTDLLDHGFQLLSASLSLREAGGDAGPIERGLQVAAESLESAARHDSQTVTERGFHLTMAAAAFHIGGYAARAYSLFEGDLAPLNLSTPERALVHLMRRDLARLRSTFVGWLTAEENTDEAVVARLTPRRDGDTDEGFGSDDVVMLALTRHFHRAVATYEHALVTGSATTFRRSLALFVRGEQAAAGVKHVPLWWAFRIARHLCDDLWGDSLRVVLPAEGGPPRWGDLREKFIRMLVERNPAELDLWPSQVEAAKRVVDAADDLVVALPTSAGKTRIAELCILRTLADERRVVYVTPLRALSAQIENGLARTFRPLGASVTSVYGASGVAHSDLETLRSAKIVVATPEKLDFAIRQEPDVINDVGLIVLDEGHMIGLGEREIRYETLVQRLLRRVDADERRLVCLSAVFSEGEAFDDFTAWLRSDAPGGSVRSIWRPTRQRLGVIRWTGSAGKLILEVDREHPFVPRFVEPQPAGRGRRTAFPNDANEFVVASAVSFLSRGQTVLVYCPEKRSVETTANAILKAHRQGYFPVALSAARTAATADARRIGREWLGDEHPAVRCLSLGVAVHHGSLPRQFLSEIESILRKRVLPVCVCSPTLAQGLDLSFGVLLFKSIYRSGEPIPAPEFANVVGRVGRAFVDLDGLYVFPVFETGTKATAKLTAFTQLDKRAKQRQLESGVRELVGLIVRVLTAKLDCDAEELAAYVLNANSPWSLPEQEGDDSPGQLDAALNELDTAILGVVDLLDLEAKDVAAYLDDCLRSSYWQRRLRHAPPATRALQEKVIRGRAIWLWARTTLNDRRAYFASGVGHKAGKAIEGAVEQIASALRDAEQALVADDLPTAAGSTARAADILFAIGPFVPDETVGDLPDLLSHWLSGASLASYPDKVAVGFIQEHVVYRLVWAVEASRLHILHLTGDSDPPGDLLALCLTYGVSSRRAALLMQGGIRSRVIATSAAAQIDEDFADFAALKNWVSRYRLGLERGPDWTTEFQKKEWARLIARFEHYDHRGRGIKKVVLRASWYAAKQPKPKAAVRVVRTGEGSLATVTSISSLPLGTTTWPNKVPGTHLFGRIRADRVSIRVAVPSRGSS